MRFHRHPIQKNPRLIRAVRIVQTPEQRLEDLDDANRNLRELMERSPRKAYAVMFLIRAKLAEASHRRAVR